MGLDNGVLVKNVTRKDLPKLMRFPSDCDYIKGEVEICYWRKCWGLRNAFLHHRFLNSDPDQWQFKLSVDDVDYLRALIVTYLKHPKDWDDSIWEFSEIKHNLRAQRWNLLLLHFWMKKHQDKEVIFYDSY